ncbi:MAG: DUF4266 domain-containing protein [Campylobacterota bacterium]|nr:DUF4266 domain-containing protein [Campylobacterota bacterium]
MKLITIMAMGSVLFLSGCLKDVKPWEKGTLAKKTTKPSPINPGIKAFEEHIYFSKEASKGGGGVAGGGCGCN